MNNLREIDVLPRTRADWAARITSKWNRAIDAIFDIGADLIAAKEALPHGEFTKMCQRELPFGERQAQRFMQIARHPILSKPEHRLRLPLSVSSLTVLAGCNDAEGLERALANGEIEREMTKGQIDMAVAKLDGLFADRFEHSNPTCKSGLPLVASQPPVRVRAQSEPAQRRWFVGPTGVVNLPAAQQTGDPEEEAFRLLRSQWLHTMAPAMKSAPVPARKRFLIWLETQLSIN